MRGLRWAVQGIIVLALWISPRLVLAVDWQPIPADELRMTSEPKAPAAPAIYLYRQVDRNDDGPYETNTVRIKILTEEGRKYANIELSYEKLRENISNIEARTVHPDGTAVPFDGTTYDKPISLTRGAKYLAKTFTLPDVHVGDVLEYRYKHRYEYGFVFNSQWLLSDDLFTRYARFSLIPYQGFTLRYSWPVGLPPGTNPPQSAHSVIRLEVRDVPAFVTEEFMPPVSQLMYRVDFVYLSAEQNDKDSVKFWKKLGKIYYSKTENFLDERRAMAAAVAQIVDPGDSPDTKMRKIYARVQQLRNTTFDRRKTQQETDREDLKSAHDVAAVWKDGYGNGRQINWLFIALARAAGLQASSVLISNRDKYFFNAKLMNPAELNNDLAVITTADGRDIYLDPGVALAPFGLLPWGETGVSGLKLDKDGGSWVNTPLPGSTESRIERRAEMQLTMDGSLAGKVTVTFIGQEALWRRLEERFEDDAERKEFLERQLAADIPVGVEAQLTNTPQWDVSENTLTAQFDLRVPGWATRAGQRLLLPSGLFAGQDKRAFIHENRIHPLYFSFAHLSIDDVSIRLPVNWQVSVAPSSRVDDRKALVYSFSADAKDGLLHSKRTLEVNSVFMELKAYGVVQDFFQQVRSTDEQQTVLIPTKKLARD